jgi:THO complex subunit 3
LNIAWSPSGSYVAFGDRTDKIHIVDTRTWTIEKTCEVGGDLYQLAWSTTDDLLYLCTGLGLVQVLSFPDMKKVHTFHAQTGAIYCIDTDPKGRYICVGGGDALVSCWDTEDGVCVRTISSMEWPVYSIATSYDGKVIAVGGSEDHHIQLVCLFNGLTHRV